MGTLRNSVFLLKGSILSLLLLILTISFAGAQERTITGKVTSADEGPLPGVNIKIQGTIKGTITDTEGNYSLVISGP